MSTKNSQFKSLFQCPVCWENAISSIFQCQNGHIICGECYRSIISCPVCRIAITSKIRNLEMEKIASIVFSQNEQSDSKEIELQSQVVELTCMLSEMEIEKNEYSQMNAILQQELTSVVDQLENTEKVASDTDNNMTTLVVQLSELQNQIHMETQQKEKNKKRLNKIKENISQLREHVNDLEEELDDRKTEYDKERSLRKKVERRYENSVKTIESLSIKIEQLKAKSNTKANSTKTNRKSNTATRTNRRDNRMTLDYSPIDFTLEFDSSSNDDS